MLDFPGLIDEDLASDLILETKNSLGGTLLISNPFQTESLCQCCYDGGITLVYIMPLACDSLLIFEGYFSSFDTL